MKIRIHKHASVTYNLRLTDEIDVVDRCEARPTASSIARTSTSRRPSEEIRDEIDPCPEVQLLLTFLEGSTRGIVKNPDLGDEDGADE